MTIQGKKILYKLYYNRCLNLLPDDKILFRYSRNPSSFMSKSVKMKVVPFPCTPQVRYKNFKSSKKFVTLYDLVKVI